MTDDLDNVIQLRMRPARELRIKNRYSGRRCKHKGVEVDAEERAVTCVTCGAVVDPFDALLALAEEHERREDEAEKLARDVAALQERLKLFEKLVKKTRDKARREGLRFLPEYGSKNSPYIVATEGENVAISVLPELGQFKAMEFANAIALCVSNLREAKKGGAA